MSDTMETVFAKISQLYKDKKCDSLIPLMVFLNLRGEPYTLKKHFQFEPLFSLRRPKRLILKCARQVGKCLPLSEIHKLRGSSGQFLNEKTLQIGVEVLSLGENGKIIPRAIEHIEYNGIKPLFHIKTRLGSDFKVTPNHPLLTPTGYIQAQNLQKGTRLAGIKQGGTFQNKSVNRARIITTAYIIGDGCCTNSKNIEITSDSVNSAVFEELKSLYSTEEYSIYAYEGKAPRFYFKKSSGVHSWLNEDILMGKGASQKVMPDWVFQLSRKDTVLFLSRLWATDGTLKTTKDVSYTSISKHLAKQVQSLLNKLGMLASIKEKPTSGQVAYVVRVEGIESLYTFMHTLDIPGKPSLDISKEWSKSNRDTLPQEKVYLFEKLFNSTLNKHSTSLSKYGLKRLPKYATSRHKVVQYLKVAKHLGLEDKASYKELSNFLYGDVSWDTIVEITPCAAEPTFDITTGPEHNFVLDGIISHNTQNVCGKNIITSWAIPKFRSLFVLPRFEQSKRLSNDVVKEFIEESQFKDCFHDKTCESSVLQRTYLNRAIQYFSYAFLDADRVRGISAIQDLYFDEAQDINWDFIPVITEVTSAVEDFGFLNFTGTPKTLDNTLTELWNDSSQAEWIIKCEHCNKYNIPDLDNDILDMIGKKCCICAKCGKPLSAEKGCYVHKFPEKRSTFVGYHVSQITHPLHYMFPGKWDELLYKQRVYSQAKFYNEILGIECDSAEQLISQSQLQQAASGPENTLEKALAEAKNFAFLVFGIDWGGGGDESDSYTALAVGGVRPGQDTIECIFGTKFKKSLEPHVETKYILELFKKFKPRFIAHDYGGAGSLRETLMLQAGVPLEKMVPFTYVCSPSKSIISYNPPQSGYRHSYSLDKSRSLIVTVTMVKAGKIIFPKWETADRMALEGSEVSLLLDFVHLYQDRQERPRGADIVLIQKKPKKSDDFAHAVNYMASCIWHSTQKYPNVAEAENIRLTAEDLKSISPKYAGLNDWSS